MSSPEPRTKAGKALLAEIEQAGAPSWITAMHDARERILAIEAEAADLPRRWPKGPTDRDGNPLPATPAETGLREAAGRVQDNAVIPDEYEGYYLVRREDYDALVLALRTALSKEEK